MMIKILGIFYFLLFLHECCHVIGYRIGKIHIKRFYVWPIDCLKVSGWRIKIKLIDNCLGVVLPDFSSDSSDKLNRKKIIVALIIPIVLHLVGSIISFSMYLLNNNLLLFNSTIINLIFFMSTFTKNNYFYGDGIAIYHIIKDDTISKDLIRNLMYKNRVS